jgi:hypothetical protein
MRRIANIVIIILILACRLGLAQGGAQPSAQANGTMIDRLVAVVNGHPLTESDVLWFLALDPEVSTETYSNDLKRRALERIIDQELLHREAEKLPTIEVTEAAISEYIAELMRHFPSEAVFRHRLEAVGLTSDALREVVKHRLEIWQFIDFRFRAFVFVSDAEIQSYYENRVVAQAKERGETAPPLDQRLRELIEKNIIEDKVASEMIAWFDESRRRSEIVYLMEY